MSKEKYSSARSCSPFDDSDAERLRRMGLLTESGAPDRDAAAVAAHLYAGLFYDSLCDFHSDMGGVTAVCRELLEYVGMKDPRRPFLAICSAYDAIYCALPDVMWWIAGNLQLVSCFTDDFIKCLAEFSAESEEM